MQAQRSYDLAGKSIFIALPAYDFKVSLKLAISLARFAQSAPQHGIDIQIGSICGCSVVSRARNLLAQDLLDSPCDYLMFIDSDINFEPEDILRLMAWGSDPKRGIVAAVPRTRSETKTYIANLEYDGNGDLTMNGMGLVRAERVATAFMLVRREVFEKMVEAHPEWKYYDKRSNRTIPCLFDFLLTEEGYIGEDYLFCDRTRELGFEVWVDPSITLGHMGVQEYVGNYGKDVLYPMIAPAVKEVA
jgi:glycosyltransferase involved in cell wall biosynthesis